MKSKRGKKEKKMVFSILRGEPRPLQSVEHIFCKIDTPRDPIFLLLLAPGQD